jgi:glycosyltransferase involved in cell wall biosynthesis
MSSTDTATCPADPAIPANRDREITVGLCSRNRKETLRKVLLTLADQSIHPDRYEVVLIDDGSTDGTGEMVASLDLPYRLTYGYQPHSALATARNHGIRLCRGEIMLYIDDDVLADHCLLEEHLRSHDGHPRCVVNGWVNHIEDDRIPERPKFTMADISTSFFWTSNVSVRVEHLLEAGMFDESFKEYGWEDQELGLRLMAIGLVRKTNYKAVGYHIKKPPTTSNIEGALRQAEAKARTALHYIKLHPRQRTRFSTGTHPPRLAWAAFTNSGGLLEKYCRSRLGLDSPGLEDGKRLTSHQAWCLKQLSTIHYFRQLRRGGSEL